MQDCSHEIVCKHKSAEPCDLTPICKHMGDGVEKPKRHYVQKHASRGPRKKSSIKKDLQWDDIEDVKIAKKELARLKKAGSLDENQSRAFSMYEGKHAKALQDGERKQIIDIYNKVKE